MAKNMRLKIGIVGCGAIGSSLAKEIVNGLRNSASLSALYDIRPEKSQLLSKQLNKNTKFWVDNLDTLISKSDLVIEASCAAAAWEIARKSLSCGRKVMVMSVGGMVDHLEQLNMAGRFIFPAEQFQASTA
jgi:aspartate dehydrogenase